MQAYANEWAYKRNPAYLNFENIGGDCTNFASQCLYAGCGVMNYLPVFGWYYKSASNRTPSWTGVQYFYNFLIANKGVGVYGNLIPKNQLETGDIIQLGNALGVFYHTLAVVGKSGEEVFVAAHSYDAFNRPLSSYDYYTARYLKIRARNYIS